MFLSKHKLFIPRGDKLRKKSTVIANALAVELHNYGIQADDDIISRISSHEPAKARDYAETILKAFTAGDVNPPLFKQWEDRTEFTFPEMLFQFMGYVFQLSGNDLEDPAYLERLRSEVAFKNQKRLQLASFAEAEEHFKGLVGSGVGLNRKQRDTMNAFAEVFATSGFIRSDEARTTVLLAKGFDYCAEMQCRPADALRYFAARRDPDAVNLPHDVKYDNLKWRERVSVLELWSQVRAYNLMEDMGRNRGAWVRFFRHINLFKQKDFARRFPRVVTCAWVSAGNKEDALPDGLAATLKQFKAAGIVDVTDEGALAYRTIASRIQTALDSGKLKKIRAAISDQPGYLLRNLATVANAVKRSKDDEFRAWVRESIADANPSVLFSLLQIDTRSEFRIIDVKGDTTIQPAAYPAIIADIQTDIEQEIKRRYAVTGKIEVTDTLKNSAVPFLSRNQELDRGTRIPFSDKRYLYFFMHWVEGNRRTDLDHSYMIFDKDMNVVDTVNYSRSTNAFIACSGDLVSAPAPHGATEYGRIDLERVPARAQYIVPVCNVYAGDVFSDNAEAYAGFQFTDSPQFELQRDHVRYDLNQPAEANVPFIIDMAKAEIMVLDFNSRNRRSASVHGYREDIVKMVKAMETRNTMTIQRFADLLSGSGDVEITVKTNPSKNGEIAPADLSRLIG